ncbi:sensor histidine kinase [Enterococcus olivae]
MKTNRWKEKRTGAQFQLTSRLVAIWVGLLIIVNLAFVSISLYSVYSYLVDQASEIIDTMETVPQESSDWEVLTDAMTAKSEEDAVRIILTDGPVYYSEGGKEVFNELAEGTALPILRGIIVADEEIYYFQREIQGDRILELAIHANTVIEMMMDLLLTSLVLNIFAVLIGCAVIYLFVGKWSKTLQQMSQEIQEIEHSQEQVLTVPETPREVKQVATAFNQLLLIQREAIEREKQFVADASHELRTPLTAIRGHVQLIKRRGTAHPEVVLPSIQFIDKESKRLETMTNQLLQLGRLNSTQPVEVVDFSQLVKQEITKLQTVSQQKVTFSVEEGIFLSADEVELQQVCQNLFENARKYSTDEDLIHIKLWSETDKILLEVRDTGIGIPDEAKERIFERFFRVDQSRSSQIEGSGIGLSIVRSIVEKYQGRIWVKDNQPKGSIFVIEFTKDEEIFM